MHGHVHVSQKGHWTFWESPSRFYPTDIGLTDKLVSEAVKRQQMVVMGKTQVTSQARLETGTKGVYTSGTSDTGVQVNEQVNSDRDVSTDACDKPEWERPPKYSLCWDCFK